MLHSGCVYKTKDCSIGTTGTSSLMLHSGHGCWCANTDVHLLASGLSSMDLKGTIESALQLQTGVL